MVKILIAVVFHQTSERQFCSDGIDNDGNGKIDDLNEYESLCSDGTDNDGDGKIDTEDNDCQPGGPCPLCSPQVEVQEVIMITEEIMVTLLEVYQVIMVTLMTATSDGDNGNVNDGSMDNGDTIQSFLSQAQSSSGTR